MNMNRFFTILCLLLCLAGGKSVIQAASWSYPTSKPSSPYAGGSGSKSDPYRISTAQQLANFAYMIHDNGKDYAGNYFILTNDIVLNEGVINADGTFNEAAASSFKQWTSPGKWRFPFDNEFEGTFDGQNHAVIGLYQDQTAMLQLGLFGMAEGATIKNVRVKDSYIRAREAGFDFENVDQYSVGMVIGYMYKSSISNCHVENSVVHADHGYHTGGVIGMTENSTVAGCSFTKGSIEVFENPKPSAEYSQLQEEQRTTFGGVIGYSYFDTSIRNCTSSGTLKCKFGCFGGVIGYSYKFSGLLTECSSTMHIVAVPLPNKHCSLLIGGVAGELWSYQDPVVTKCAYYGNITVEEGDYEFWGQFIVSGLINAASNVRGLSDYPHVFKDCASIGDITFKGKVKSCSNLYINGLSCHCVYESYDHGYDMVTTAVNCIAYHKVSFTDGQTATHYNYNPLIGYPEYIEDLYPKWPRFNSEDSKNNYYGYQVVSGTDPGVSREYGTAKTLAELKASISTLNAEAGSNVWGKYTNTEDEVYYGIPLPIACGGTATSYSGVGTENNPYIISSEADLKALKTTVNDGNDLKDKYFKLDADINMTGVMDYCIGFFKEKPFKGHLDGNGHAIVGLRNKLFGYMYGTVKNLALVDCNIEGCGDEGAVAGFVGGESNKAEVSNCYVSGLVQSSQSGISEQIRLGGICGYVYNGSAVHDCYFKGHLIAKSPYGSVPSATHSVGGISGYNGNSMVDTSKPQGIYNCYASFEYHKDLGYFTNFYAYGIGNNYVQDCYAITSSEINNTTGCTKLDSESELNGKFNGKTGWLQGVYRPVLAYAKKYAATTPEKTPTTVYFDAIPEANPTPNYFYNISIDDPYSDVSLWNLPNMAVYVPSEQKDYITNGYLDQSAELKYKRSEGATGTLGQLHFSLVQNNKGSHFVCLPGEVLKSDLPEGSDAMIVGKINYVNDEEQVNVVHVDTIPAGVPCFLYVPVTAVKSGNNIDMLMRSGIVSEPVMNADYSSFKGTFSPQTVSEQACLDVAKETLTRSATRGAAQVEDAYYFIRGNEQAEVKPFSAWIESSLGNVRIVDYLLLDEYSQTNEELIENSTDDVNIKLRLTMDADKWTTVCLPFDMSGDEIKEKFGEDTKLEEVESVSYDGTTLNIKLKEATDGIVTGYPYFIKPSAGNSIFDLGPRILSNELSEDGYMAISTDATRELSLKMGGLYGMSVLSSTKDYGAYYFNDDTLIQIPSGNPLTLGGFRCWFKASDTTASAPAELSSVVITHSDGTLTDIQVVAKDSQATKQTIYDLRGIEKRSEKGIYIKGGKLRMF